MCILVVKCYAASFHKLIKLALLKYLKCYTLNLFSTKQVGISAVVFCRALLKRAAVLFFLTLKFKDKGVLGVFFFCFQFQIIIQSDFFFFKC